MSADKFGTYGIFTNEEFKALRLALARGMGREPTPDEELSVVSWAIDIHRDAQFVQAMLEGELSLDIRDGLWAFAPVKTEAQA